jgi:hypothetical protein
MNAGAPRWPEQWERVQRLYRELFDLVAGQPAPVNERIALDKFQAFFIHCYQLKDWLKNDPTFSSPLGGVENFVNANWALKVCADIANSEKQPFVSGLLRQLSRVGDGDEGQDCRRIFGLVVEIVISGPG